MRSVVINDPQSFPLNQSQSSTGSFNKGLITKGNIRFDSTSIMDGVSQHHSYFFTGGKSFLGPCISVSCLDSIVNIVNMNRTDEVLKV